MNPPEVLQSWLRHVFDHPAVAVKEEKWYWAEGAPEWNGSAEQIVLLITETFESGGKLLVGFSDAQLDQGFWYLAWGELPHRLLPTLIDPAVPPTARIRALKSFVPLFEQVMALRCSPLLGHLGEPVAGFLNDACYMWWDSLRGDFFPHETERSEFAAAVVEVIRRQLAIPHDACRESALHGIGHWVHHYPDLAGLVDEFLSTTPALRPELIAYARRARAGIVL